jgi:hypothetical protein
LRNNCNSGDGNDDDGGGNCDECDDGYGDKDNDDDNNDDDNDDDEDDDNDDDGNGTIRVVARNDF